MKFPKQKRVLKMAIAISIFCVISLQFVAAVTIGRILAKAGK